MVAMGQASTASSCRVSEGTARHGHRAAGRSTGGTATERLRILSRTVELEVIPSLLRARGIGRAELAPAAEPTEAVTSAHVAELVACTLDGADPATSGFVAAMQDQGFRAEALYLDLLAPAANRLGELWAEDLCTFTDVTVGLIRLQRAMRLLSPAFLGSNYLADMGRQAGPRALLVPLPGEQHTFGLSMVSDFFRRAGWSVWSGPVATTGELATMVRSSWVDVVGFSLSCDERIDTVRSEIRSLRLASRNPGLAVMVGGPPFVLDPRLADAVGADGTARDGWQAVGNAHSLLQRETERR